MNLETIIQDHQVVHYMVQKLFRVHLHWTKANVKPSNQFTLIFNGTQWKMQYSHITGRKLRQK